MPGPLPASITLTPEQLAILQSITQRHKAPQSLVQRARILLLAHDGLGHTDIARQLNTSSNTAGKWRQRWLEAADKLEATNGDTKKLTCLIEEILEDAPRSGAPVSFTAEALAKIIALACQEPRFLGREVTHWTPRELADEAIRQGIVETISPRSVGRLLKRGRPQASPEPLLAQSRD